MAHHGVPRPAERAHRPAVTRVSGQHRADQCRQHAKRLQLHERHGTGRQAAHQPGRSRSRAEGEFERMTRAGEMVPGHAGGEAHELPRQPHLHLAVARPPTNRSRSTATRTSHPQARPAKSPHQLGDATNAHGVRGPGSRAGKPSCAKSSRQGFCQRFPRALRPCRKRESAHAVQGRRRARHAHQDGSARDPRP